MAILLAYITHSDDGKRTRISTEFEINEVQKLGVDWKIPIIKELFGSMTEVEIQDLIKSNAIPEPFRTYARDRSDAISRLGAAIGERDRKIKALEAENEKLKEAGSDLASRVTGLVADGKKKARLLSQAEQVLAQRLGRIKDLSEEVDALTLELQKKNAEIQTLRGAAIKKEVIVLDFGPYLRACGFDHAGERK